MELTTRLKRESTKGRMHILKKGIKWQKSLKLLDSKTQTIPSIGIGLFFRSSSLLMFSNPMENKEPRSPLEGEKRDEQQKSKRKRGVEVEDKKWTQIKDGK